MIDKINDNQYNIYMNDYELSKIADMLDEDALYPDEVEECFPQGTDFKQKYLEFYDDIKTTPNDDW